MTKKAVIIIQVIGSIIFLLIVFNTIEWKNFFNIIEAAKSRGFFFLLLVIIIFVSNFFLALRWHALIEHGTCNKLTVWELFKVNVISRFFAFFLPGRFTPDVYRIYILGSRTKQMSNSFLSVALDRYLGQVAIFAMGSFAVLFFQDSLGSKLSLTIISIFTLLLLSTVFIYINAKLRIVERSLYRFKVFRKRSYRIFRFLRKTLYSRKMPKALIYNFCYQLFVIFSIYASFLIFTADISLLKVTLAAPVVILLSILPASINGIGQREVIYVFIFSLLEVEKEVALSASLAALVANLINTLIGGVFYLLKKTGEFRNPNKKSHGAIT